MRIALPAKLMASYLLVMGLVFTPLVLVLKRSLFSTLEENEVRTLEQHLEAVRGRLEHTSDADRDRVLREMAALLGERITYVDGDGTVLVDTDLAPDRVAKVESHADRPEVQEALAGRYGHSHRISRTVGAELIYGALPVPAAGAPRGVIRLAAGAASLHDSTRGVLLGLRLAAGVGVTVAIGFSLVAAFFVSLPLRRMRDAAAAYSQLKWKELKPVRTRDELGELSVALGDLGRKLREHLIEVGAQESLLLQALEVLPLPAFLLGNDFQPQVVNGAFRRAAGITAADETQRLLEISRATQLTAGRSSSETSGLPTAVSLSLQAGDQALAGVLTPLTRPSGPPLWLLLLDPDRPESEARGPEAVHRVLASADRLIDQLWQAHPEERAALANLRRRIDDAAHAAGQPAATGVEPIAVGRLIARCREEVSALLPQAIDRLSMEEGGGGCEIAESAGLAARALRLFVGGALRALPHANYLDVTVETTQKEVKLLAEGGAPPDLQPVREAAQALGGDAGRVSGREREAAWLTLPRA